jgi:hypothetical protein
MSTQNNEEPKKLSLLLDYITDKRTLRECNLEWNPAGFSTIINTFISSVNG